MTAKLKAFTEKYPYTWVIAYFPIYLIWFFWLESRANEPYHVIHFPLDDLIPFCEYFIIPYLLWFLYIGVVYIWMFFHSREQFFRYIAFLYTGMTLFLIISTIYPNGHLLRPLQFDHDNLFVQLVCFIYWADTSTNILPSIHVFNSISAHMAVMHSPELVQKRRTVWISRILCVSIILSTMFLKQHSCIDVMLGICSAAVLNQVVYHSNILVKAHHFIGKFVSDHRDFSSAFSRKVHGTTEDAEI